MADEKKDKEIKVNTKEKERKPMEDQKITTESTADVAPSTNNSGKNAMIISLIALAVAAFSFFAPAPSTPKADLSKIEKKIDKVSKKAAKKQESMRHEIDKMSASLLKEQKGTKNNLDSLYSSVTKAHSILEKMNLSVVETRHILDYQIADAAEKFEQQKNEANLGSGFSDLITEIQPSLRIYCKRANVSYIKLAKTAKTDTNTVAVDCNFNNSGTLKANIVPGSIVMIGGKGQKVIDNAVERIDNGEETTILPGRSNDKQYHIVLTDDGASNVKGGVLKMSFQASTDKAALGIIKRKTNKEISGKQLKELTKKSHIFSFLL
jgi:hypothetical protein